MLLMKIAPADDEPWVTTVEMASPAASACPLTVPVTEAVPVRLYVLSLPPHAAESASEAVARSFLLMSMIPPPFVGAYYDFGQCWEGGYGHEDPRRSS